MGTIGDKLSSLIPSEAKLILFVVVAIALLGALGYLYYRIDKGGYDRCETKHNESALKLNIQSQAEIAKRRTEHAKTKTQILNLKGPDDPVGPRVTLAIDSLPPPYGR